MNETNNKCHNCKINSLHYNNLAYYYLCKNCLIKEINNLNDINKKREMIKIWNLEEDFKIKFCNDFDIIHRI